MKKCPKCKREIESNSAFCEYCGHKLKRSVWPVFLVLGILIIGGGAIVLTMKNTKEAEKELSTFQECSTIKDYREYLRQYPQGKYVEQASGKIQKMINDSVREAQSRYEEAELIAFNNCSSTNACRQYCINFPNIRGADIQGSFFEPVEINHPYNICRFDFFPVVCCLN